MNIGNVDLSTVVVEGIDMADYPDFADAMAVEARFKNGRELTELELEEFTAEGSIVHELAHDSLF